MTRPQAPAAPCFEALEPRTLLSAGVPDPSFGAFGKVLTPGINSDGDVVRAVARQADGKLLVASYRIHGDIDVNFAVTRFTAGGKLDTTFGVGGTREVDFGGSDNLGAMAVAADGRIVLAGVAQLSTGTAIAVARLTAGGAPDPTFGIGGRSTTKGTVVGADGVESVGAVAIQGDSIVVGGCGGTGAGPSFVVARFTAGGQLDATFGDHGRAVTFVGNPFLSFASFAKLIPLRDGRIVAVGDVRDFSDDILHPTPSRFELARYTRDGRIDRSFGNGGLVVTAFGPAAGDSVGGAALQSDGKIVVVGTHTITSGFDPVTGPRFSSDFAVARFNPDGSLDASFGPGGADGDGRVLVDFGRRAGDRDFAADVVVQPDGRIVVAGSSDGDFAVARLLPGGAIDPTFGNGPGPGRTRLDVGTDDVAAAVLLGSDGSIVVAGTGQSATPNFFNQIGLARLTNDIPPLDRVTASVANGTLNIFGTPDDDAIVVTLAGGQFSVAGVATKFAAGMFSRINVTAFGGNDRVDLSGVNVPAAIDGGDGDDSLTGSQAADVIDGGNANDLLAGGNGRDVLRGGAGADNLSGNNGDDVLDGGAGPDRIAGQRGVDTADYRLRAAGVAVSLDNAPNDGEAGERDNVIGDVEVVLGGAGNDLLVGAGGGQTLFGGAGDDTLRGGDGDDFLNGGPGRNQLFGDAGNDQLVGRNGQTDVLDGGPGFDRAAGDPADVRTDIEGVLA